MTRGSTRRREAQFAEAAARRGRTESNTTSRKSSSSKQSKPKKRRKTPVSKPLRHLPARGRNRKESTKTGADYQCLMSMGITLDNSLRGGAQLIEKQGKFNCYKLGYGVEVKRTTLPHTSRKNRGLFAQWDIKKNHLITEYSGVSINREQAMELRRKGKATHIKGLNYDHFLNGDRFPQMGQGAAQMANDGKDFAGQNAKFVVKFDSCAGGDRCFLKALRDIKAEEEIFVSYGKGYWSNVHLDEVK
mmetsp:Transcript_8763/g.13849  ORF Transcript_8763/g.13849 Transcript_8763/m.13849 type:complete len:246 (-) Transcript_8763:272-1009(-)